MEKVPTSNTIETLGTVLISAAVPVAPNKNSKCILVAAMGTGEWQPAGSHRSPIIIRIFLLELYILFMERLNTKFNRI